MEVSTLLRDVYEAACLQSSEMKGSQNSNLLAKFFIGHVHQTCVNAEKGGPCELDLLRWRCPKDRHNIGLNLGLR